MSHRVFITGITGMVGSHLADYIINNTKYHWIILSVLKFLYTLSGLLVSFQVGIMYV